MTELQRYKLACSILRAALSGCVDSQDASDIADIVIEGKEIDWANYSESTKKEIEGLTS